MTRKRGFLLVAIWCGDNIRVPVCLAPRGCMMQRIVVHGWILGLCSALATEPRASTNLPPSDPRATARVVIIEDERATVAFNAQEEIIQKMVAAGITRLTGKKAP